MGLEKDLRKKGLIKAVLDNFGDDIKMREEKTEGMPSGSLALDICIGVGGFPKGRFTEIYGSESTGKTSLCLATCRQLLKRVKNEDSSERIVYIDTENSLDYNYIKQIMGDYYNNEHMTIFQPKVAEDALEIALLSIQDDVDLIILDSVASLSPSDELKKSMSDLQVGLLARLIAKFLRMAVFDVREKNITFLFTNQVRAKIGSYAKSYETPAGNALKHYISTKVFLGKGEKITLKGEEIGNRVKFTIKKNKVGQPFMSARTNNIFGTGINFERDVIEFSKMLGVVQQASSYYKLDGETIGNSPGIVAVCEELNSNRILLDNIIKRCYNAVNIEIPTYLEGTE